MPATDARQVPLADALEIMTTMVIPASALFDIIVEPPANDEDWEVLRRNAEMLVESGRLPKSDRHADDTEWIEFSQQLMDSALVALRALETRDLDATLEAGDVLLDACTTCHARYLVESVGGIVVS